MITVRYDFDIEKTKDKFNILKIYKNNKKMYIGSKYAMQQEVDKFLNDLTKDAEEDSVFIIFGLATGKCIKKICEMYPNSKIIVFEPNIKLIEYIKKNQDKYNFLSKDNLYLINCEKEELISNLKSILSEYEITKIIYKSILNYDKIYYEQILEFDKIIKEVITDRVINRNTSLLYAETWFSTLTKSLNCIINSDPVNQYKDTMASVPAVIVSAGPSLSKNIDRLHAINNGMIVLTGGRTLKSLIDNNINPNLIGVVDPSERSYELVDGYIDKCKAPLLFYEGTNSKIVKKHSGKKIFFTQSNMVQNIFDMKITSLGMGGSIAHTLTGMAILLGCNPIIFIGQDLAYTDDKFHDDLAINQFETLQDNDIKDEGEIYVDSVNGDKIKTSRVLNNFRRQLEEIIKEYPNTTFINATEGGARINGTIEMTLKDAINKYKLNRKVDLPNYEIKIDRHLIKNNTIKMLRESIDAINFIKVKCEKALSLIDNLDKYLIIKNKFKINEILKELDIIDEKIKHKYKNLEILNNLIYPIIYFVLADTTAKSDKDIIKKNKYLYNSMLQKIKYAEKPIKSTLKQIENTDIYV